MITPIVKIGNETIVRGTIIEVPHIAPDFKFQVVGVGMTAFDVVWTSGKEKGQSAVIPYSLFGDQIKVVAVGGDKDSMNPNTAFLYKRISDAS